MHRNKTKAKVNNINAYQLAFATVHSHLYWWSQLSSGMETTRSRLAVNACATCFQMSGWERWLFFRFKLLHAERTLLVHTWLLHHITLRDWQDMILPEWILWNQIKIVLCVQEIALIFRSSQFMCVLSHVRVSMMRQSKGDEITDKLARRFRTSINRCLNVVAKTP